MDTPVPELDLVVSPERLETCLALQRAACHLTQWRTPRPPETVDDITDRLRFEILVTAQAYGNALARLERHLQNYPDAAQ